MKRTERTRVFYRSLSPFSRAQLEAAIFCLFAPIGAAIDILMFGERSWPVLGLLVIMSGGIAVLYGRAGFTGRYGTYITAGVVLQVLLMVLTRWLRPEGAASAPLDAAAVEALRDRIKIDVALLTIFIALGYALFVSVFTREGLRYFATSAEIRLAQRIHQRLVPALAGANGDAEWVGVSRPSGDIGGDLVDVVEGPGGLVGCVADVSGHGVGAGLLMGMFKTAFRASASRMSDPAELLADIHIALSPLTEPNMFATAGVLRVTPGELHYAGGGHPPLLLYRRATARIEEIASNGPAVALLDDFSCSTMALPFSRGDVALLLTDGILEALDSSEAEVGVASVSRVLAAHAAAPMQDLLNRIASLASVGTRIDDQTVLIVRAL